jgi:GT2 family glycosyltransferase
MGNLLPLHSPLINPVSSPVLLLLFNRPDYTKILLEAIASIPLTSIYIAIDGPRTDHPEDINQINEVKKLVEGTQFRAPVIHKLYRDHNLGCRNGVKNALDWFFQQEEAGIILEDDCIPDPSFFPYCDELLEKYAKEEKDFAISGDNFLMEKVQIRDSYYFS